MHRTPPLVGVVMVLLAASEVAAQPGFERVVGPDGFGTPIVLSRVDGRTLAAFARAAGVPTGLELAPAPRGQRPRPVTLTGLRIAKALQVIAEFDPRYEMRESDGVFVLRPREAWDSPDHPLHAPVPPVVLLDVRARNALSLIAASLGAPQYRDLALGDTKRFSLKLQEGTVLDLLNATVRAHGEIAWSFEASTNVATSIFPYTVALAGFGCGVPGVAPEGPLDVSLYADPVLLSINGSAAVLDRVIGNGPLDRALVVNGPYQSAIYDLVRTTKVSMGIESLGAGGVDGSIPATGRTLREVLDAMIALDPRYEWREMDGVIVVRPRAAWNDPESVLFRLIPAVQLVDVSLQEAVKRLARELGHPNGLDVPQGRTISVDQPHGSVLDLLNAIVRAHGEMSWAFAPMSKWHAVPGYQYTLTIKVAGGDGAGFWLR